MDFNGFFNSKRLCLSLQGFYAKAAYQTEEQTNLKSQETTLVLKQEVSVPP